MDDQTSFMTDSVSGSLVSSRKASPRQNDRRADLSNNPDAMLALKFFNPHKREDVGQHLEVPHQI